MLVGQGRHIHEIYQDFIKITDTVAREVYPLSGKGEKFEADKIAVDTMKRILNELPYKVVILIGEGEKDNSAILEHGEKFGLMIKDKQEFEIVVDPLECTTNFAKGLPDSLSILMVARKGTIQNVPGTYMKQILLPREVKDKANLILNQHIDCSKEIKSLFDKYFYFEKNSENKSILKTNKRLLDSPLEDLLKIVAFSKEMDIQDLTVVVQDRPRHSDLIHQIRDIGAGVALIDSGSISASAEILLQKEGRYSFLLGTYGAPEGLFVSFMAKSTNAIFLGRVEPHNEKCEKITIEMKIIDQILDQDEWVKDEAIIIMSGIHSSHWLPGIRRIVKKIKKNDNKPNYRYLVSTVVWTVNNVILVECENGDIRSKQVLFQ